MLVVRTQGDIDSYLGRVRQAAFHVRAWMSEQVGEPLDTLRRMKFDAVGYHPIDGHALNLVEQINQTWTYLVALAAARQLLALHPEAGGYRLAPGAHAAQPLDIMSEADGLVGAETFAAVDPHNNRKLALDLEKMAKRTETHRYIFFMSPKFPGNRSQPDLKLPANVETNGVQIWSVDI
jgi:hypothetical protein